jgi:hypothetical protein
MVVKNLNALKDWPFNEKRQEGILPKSFAETGPEAVRKERGNRID